MIDDPRTAINVGFLVLFTPILTIWACDLFVDWDDEEHGHEESRFRMTWPLRLSAIPVIALCVFLVVVGAG